MKLDRSNIEAWLLDRLEGRLTPDQERELAAFLLAHPDLAEELGELPEVEKPHAFFPGKEGLKRTLPPRGELKAGDLDDFLVARMEGDLTTEQNAQLERFIAADPEAGKAARLMEAARIQRDQLAIMEKASITRAFPPQGMPDRHRIDDFLVARLHGELNAGQAQALDWMIAADPAIARSWALMQHTRLEAAVVVYADKAGLKKKEVKVIPLWSRPAFRYAAAASVALLLGLWWMTREERPENRLADDRVEKVTPEVPHQEGGPRDASSTETKDVQVTKPDTEVQQQEEGQHPTYRKQHDPADVTPSPAPIQRSARERMDRLEPNLASLERQQEPGSPRAAGPVPQVPISSDVPSKPAAQGQGAMSLGELLASAVRSEVLDQPSGQTRALDRSDAVALVDRGLNTLGGDRAGLAVQRTPERRRFNLRLGGGLAIAASTSR